MRNSEIYLRTGHESPEGECRYIYTLSLTSALDGVGGKRHASAVLPPGMIRYQKLVWTGAENLVPTPGFDHRSESLYRPRYRKSNVARAKHLLLKCERGQALF